MFAYFWGAILIALPLFVKAVPLSYSLCQNAGNQAHLPTIRCSNHEVFNLKNSELQKTLVTKYGEEMGAYAVATKDFYKKPIMIFVKKVQSRSESMDYFFLFSVIFSMIFFGTKGIFFKKDLSLSMKALNR